MSMNFKHLIGRIFQDMTTWKMRYKKDCLDLGYCIYFPVLFQTRIDTPLLVNIKGCGYPPETSCPVFANRFNEIYKSGKTFPCHYSRENPWIVLQYYNYEESIFSIAASILIPNVIFVVSLLILLYWYCPYCQAKCKKYEDQIDQEDAEDIGQETTKPTE